MSETANERAIREANVAGLNAAGFSIAVGLPLWSEWSGSPITLRPKLDICRRLMCSEIATAYIWSANTPEEKLRAYIARSRLMDSMSELEHQILLTPRSDAEVRFGGVDGWRQENQWALAWVLGFELEPGLHDGFIDESVMGPLVREFMPSLEESDSEFSERVHTRPMTEVLHKFDLFYCAHNAVRSAQQDGSTAVPAGFDPIVDGGVLHEKRHSLTWCISPGVSWDETDLST